MKRGNWEMQEIKDEKEKEQPKMTWKQQYYISNSFLLFLAFW